MVAWLPYDAIQEKLVGERGEESGPVSTSGRRVKGHAVMPDRGSTWPSKPSTKNAHPPSILKQD